MTIHHRLFALTKKLAKARSNKEKSEVLNKADFLSNEAKNRIKKNLSEPEVQEQLANLKDIDVKNDWKKVAKKLPV